MRRTTTIYILILIAACALAYANTLGHEFVHDDKLEILENKYAQSLEHLPRAFTTSAWGWQDRQVNRDVSNYYRPVQTVTYALLYTFFGADPKPFHAYKLILHALCAVLVFLVCREIARDGNIALLAGLLFALHPMHVESVTWIAGITDVNCALFALASFYFFLRYLHSGRRRQGALSALCFFLALLSKEIAAMTLPLFLIYEYLFRGSGDTLTQGRISNADTRYRSVGTPTETKSSVGEGARPLFACPFVCGCHQSLSRFFRASERRKQEARQNDGRTRYAIRITYALPQFNSDESITYSIVKQRSTQYGLRYAPYILLTGLYLALRVNALGALAPEGKYPGLTGVQVVLNAFALLMKYLGKLLLPLSFNFHYTFDPVLSVYDARFLAAFALTGGLIFSMWRLRKKNPVYVFCLCWTIFTLLPVLHCQKLGLNVFTERYLYLPSVGFCLLASEFFFWALRKTFKRLCHPDPERSEGEGSQKSRFFARVRLLRMTEAFRYVPHLLLAAVLVFYFLQTVRRNGVLENDLTLWEATAAASPDDAFVRKALGNALAERDRVEEAMAQYARALRIDPDYEGVHDNWGTLLARQGKHDEAAAHYREALRIDPDSMAGYINLGNLLAGQGKGEKAKAQYSQALRIAPGSPDAHNGLGRLLAREGKIEEAKEQFFMALRADPENAFTHNDLGNVFAGQGEFEKALEHYSRAQAADPGLADAHYNAANVLIRQGKSDEAVGHYRAALRINPQDTDARYDLGNVLARQRKFDEAVGEFREVLKIDPGDLDARNNLAVVLMEQGNLDEAIRQFEEVLRTDPRYPNARAGLNIAVRKREAD